MVLEEIMRAVAELNEKERRLLLLHIEKFSKAANPLTPIERTQQLNAALDMLGDSLSQAQLDEMTAAMTEDYIETWDESLWTQ